MSRPSKLKIWFQSCRPKTLPAAAAPVLIGAAMAYTDTDINILVLSVTLIAALLIQIATNLANDYYDYIKGADTADRLGPTRATQAGLVHPSQMKAAFILTFALAVTAGLYLVYKGGLPILAIGLISIACGILYTAGPFSLGYLGLADIFVLVFFGPVAVGGTYYLQTATIAPHVIIAGLSPGLISVAILTVNNFRDCQTDRSAGKKTLVVRFGPRFGIYEYLFSIVATCLIPIYLCISLRAHYLCLISLFTLIIALPRMKTICSKPSAETLNNTLAQTGKILIAYSVLFSIGWVI